ncbi:ATP-binding protein [Salsuginibacillus kocurii]|uniref:ATP-binding protein n=1 Tax=Salsuginibacillus kocurii TaxID=427078 RepID=UPI000380767C|nr:ATP-binding protein [Salsuginibacillus kocurii]
MLELLSGLINNLFFVMIPILLYYLFKANRYETLFEQNKVLITVLLSISIILCMLFPFATDAEGEFIIDLRQIPIIIGALYGGYGVGGALLAVFAAMRLSIGGEGVYTSMVNVVMLVAFLPLLRARFFQWSHTKRIIVVSLIAFFSVVANVFGGTLLFGDPIIELAEPYITAALAQFIGTAVVALLIEQMIKNQKMQRSVIQNKKLEVVSHLAASIAHEIRNPLQSIKGFTQLLQQERPTPAKQQEYLSIVEEEIKAAERILNNYLMYAKPGTTTTTPIYLEDVVDHVVQLLEPYAKQHHTQISFSPTHKAQQIEADPHHLSQCLINIGKNGIEAIEGSGTLTLSTEPNGHYARLRIQDDGIGMTKEEVAHLGEPYFTLKKNGTGLGLMAVFTLLQNMKGRVTIHSEKGSGTEFIIDLPLAKRPSASE